ncbi:MAG: hypothetical protein HY664_06585 [Chloroflexi bacterium]|nr:hypothetical protein [Chloroflexota bacterium]
MYLPAHLATGYAIGKGLGKWTGIPFAWYSHYVLDTTWKTLYHGPISPAQGAVMAVASLLLVWFGRRQWPCVLAAVAADSDRVLGALLGWNWTGAGPFHSPVFNSPIFQNPWVSIVGQTLFALFIVARLAGGRVKVTRVKQSFRRSLVNFSTPTIYPIRLAMSRTAGKVATWLQALHAFFS